MNWRRLRSRIAYRREKAKTKHHASPEFSGFCLSVISLLGFYCTVWPRHSGVAGAMLARGILRAFGEGSFLLWALLGYRGARLIFHREDRRPWRYVLVDGILVLSACALITTMGTIFLDKNLGGYSGKFSAQLLDGLFGRWGGFFMSGAVLIAVLMWRSGTRPAHVAQWFWLHLIADWREWRQTVQIQKSKAAEPTPPKAMPKVMPKIAGNNEEQKPPFFRCSARCRGP